MKKKKRTDGIIYILFRLRELLSSNGPKAANWIRDFQDMAEDAFADSSSHSRLLGKILILESYVHTLCQSLADSGRTVSPVLQEALDVLWDYLEGKKASSDLQDFQCYGGDFTKTVRKPYGK